MIGTLFRFLFIIVDKLGNVILLGSPHKTISMRLAFAIHCEFVKPRYSWVVPFGSLVDVLFHNRFYSLEEDHIYKNYEAEEILSIGLWDWHIITDPVGYKNLENAMEAARFMGRER